MPNFSLCVLCICSFSLSGFHVQWLSSKQPLLPISNKFINRIMYILTNVVISYVLVLADMPIEKSLVEKKKKKN